MFCAIIDRIIQFIENPSYDAFGMRRAKLTIPLNLSNAFHIKSSFKGLVKKFAGWDFVLILWIHISLPTYDRK